MWIETISTASARFAIAQLKTPNTERTALEVFSCEIEDG
jgi:hypothetical protein